MSNKEMFLRPTEENVISKFGKVVNIIIEKDDCTKNNAASNLEHSVTGENILDPETGYYKLPANTLYNEYNAEKKLTDLQNREVLSNVDSINRIIDGFMAKSFEGSMEKVENMKNSVDIKGK